MRVLFVPPMSYPLHYGGFESQITHIYMGLKKVGVEVFWYNLTNTDLNQFDIVHFHSSVTEFTSIALKAKDLGKIIVITSMIGSPRYSNNSYKLKLYFSYLPGLFYVQKKIKQLYALADHFITLTNFERERLQSVYNINKGITVIPNGIDEHFFSSDSIDINLPFEDYIVVVGRIEPDKNQLPLIEVANEMGLNLLIVGEPGSGQKKYYQICKEKAGDNVVFWGKEIDPNIMRVIYKNALITAIPSKTEMLPLVIFESLSQKTPVLCTTNCGLYPESIPGIFYSRPVKMDILKCVKQILHELPQTNIGNQGIYTWDDIAVQYANIYKTLTNSI